MLPSTSIIGKRLKELRIKSDNTMEEEAFKLNTAFNLKITKSMMSRWESGQSQPSSIFLSAYAKFHNIDLNYIAGLTNTCSSLNDKLSVTQVEAIALSKPEQDLVIKYRCLPTSGKATVDAVLDVQYDIIKHKIIDKKII